jgi:hypothetical protein
MHTKLRTEKFKGNRYLMCVGMIRKTLIKLIVISHFMSSAYQEVEETSDRVEYSVTALPQILPSPSSM